MRFKTKGTRVKNPLKIRRQGALTKGEKVIIEQFAAEQPAEIQPTQVRALAKTLNRSLGTVKNAVEKARESFTSRAEWYVNTHRQAIEDALAVGDSKALEVAVKGAQWAMQNLSSEGKRIIEKEVIAPQVPRVMIGINLGGVDLNKIKDEAPEPLVTDITDAQ